MSCNDQVCWVCLCGEEAGELTIPCKCPALYSHQACLARWQLQQAGREEERCCRFCSSTLPVWAQSLLNEPAVAQNRSAVPIMAVVYNNRMVKLPCAPGKAGAELFKQQVRQVFGLDESVSLDVTFELKVPVLTEHSAQSKVYLKGFGAFEAASTVAAMCAARRQGRRTTAPADSPATHQSDAGPSSGPMTQESKERPSTGVEHIPLVSHHRAASTSQVSTEQQMPDVDVIHQSSLQLGQSSGNTHEPASNPAHLVHSLSCPTISSGREATAVSHATGSLDQAASSRGSNLDQVQLPGSFKARHEQPASASLHPHRTGQAGAVSTSKWLRHNGLPGTISDSPGWNPIHAPAAHQAVSEEEAGESGIQAVTAQGMKLVRRCKSWLSMTVNAL